MRYLLTFCILLLGCTQENPDYVNLSKVNRLDFSPIGYNFEHCPFSDVYDYCEETYEMRVLSGDCDTPYLYTDGENGFSNQKTYIYKYEAHCSWRENGELVVYPESTVNLRENFYQNGIQCIRGDKEYTFRQSGVDKERATYAILDTNGPIFMCGLYGKIGALDELSKKEAEGECR